MLHRQVFSSSVCHVVAALTQASTTKVYQQCWKGWAGWCTQEGVPNNAISKLADFLVHVFGVGLSWHTIDIYHSAISALLEPNQHHKVSDHPIISKLMCTFYFWHSASHKHQLVPR